MSSFKYKSSALVKCPHCKFPCNSPRCFKCKLWNYHAIINDNPQIIDIKTIYVINLEKDKQRLKSFFNLIKKQNISTKNRQWFRFNAIDGSSIGIEEIENLKNKEKVVQYLKKRPGSIGCYLSHLKLWKKILNDDSSEFTLILEDDSYFTLNGLANLEIVMKKAKNLDWDILYVGHNKLKGTNIHPLFLRPSVPRKGENNIGFNSGLYGYVVRKSGLQKLINIVERFDSMFIDVQLRDCFGEFSALFITSELIKHLSGQSSRKNRDINFNS